MTDNTRASEDCTIDEPDFIASYQGDKRVDVLGTANRIPMTDGQFHRAIASVTEGLR